MAMTSASASRSMGVVLTDWCNSTPCTVTRW
ncbi:Uncharacterised protein [Bordetella pertussis]|nr:Uncharacterised protein [Bordetella pertussis]CFU79989.1 Uncharacterised protein [Bordetella pertussis]CFV96447.1 Uncharacterised protein [Bordetella pertussis]CFW45503.1 Uncharacterised protein [Bordetella pertussis]CPK80085.1 Uncharacterised protein [Bordetella pertussis]